MPALSHTGLKHTRVMAAGTFSSFHIRLDTHDRVECEGIGEVPSLNVRIGAGRH